jgi:hypothetical protein
MGAKCNWQKEDIRSPISTYIMTTSKEGVELRPIEKTCGLMKVSTTYLEKGATLPIHPSTGRD